MLARVPPDPLHMEGQTALLCPFRELQGNQVIPAVAIDAALGAMRPLPPVEDRSRRRMVEVILEAAAPHMLAGIISLHERKDGDYADGNGQVWTGAHCAHCRDEWPCKTIEAITP